MRFKNQWNKELDENGNIIKQGMKPSKTEINFNKVLRRMKTEKPIVNEQELTVEWGTSKEYKTKK